MEQVPGVMPGPCGLTVSGCNRWALQCHSIMWPRQAASHTEFALPGCSRLHSQYLPAILAIPYPADGVGLLFGEPQAKVGLRTLTILTHVKDRREESLDAGRMQKRELNKYNSVWSTTQDGVIPHTHSTTWTLALPSSQHYWYSL